MTGEFRLLLTRRAPAGHNPTHAMADTTKVDKKRKPDEELQKEDSSVVLIIREQEQEVPDFYVVPRAELNDQQVSGGLFPLF